MGLYETIEADMKQALKNGDSLRLSVLRLLVSELRTREIEKKVKRLEEPDILQTIQRQIKQRKDSIEQFGKGARQDLVDKESGELKVLEGYMPKQLSEAEVLEAIKSAISETGAAAKSDAGRVMKLIMEKLRGKADGKLVNQLVMGLLK